MQRICNTLAINGYNVLLTGRKLKHSIPLKKENYRQKRISCLFNKSFLFYIEYNVRLLFFLLFAKADIICAIDLDTILPCLLASAIKNKIRVYDAHELFAEQKEIITRPFVHKVWITLERFAVPKFKNGYTVNSFIKDELHERYGVNYEIVRNLPLQSDSSPIKNINPQPYIIYQGAVNQGRSFETLIPAMKYVDAQLVICGNGNFYDQVKGLIAANNVSDKVILKGLIQPNELRDIAAGATLGVTLFEATGLNQYQSLANRFFDYIMAGIPQVCVNYPEYKKVNDVYNIGVMIDDTSEASIATAINLLLNDSIVYEKLRYNTLKARAELNWQAEQKHLLEFYKKLQ